MRYRQATIEYSLKHSVTLGFCAVAAHKSELLLALQTISQSQFDTAQKLRTARADYASYHHPVLLNTRGKVLLSGNVDCDHCEAKLAPTTNNKCVKNTDGGCVSRTL